MAKTHARDSTRRGAANARLLSATRQRGLVPSAQLVPLQFRMPAKFVRAFKQAALDRDMKLNELLHTVFDAFIRSARKA
jgi:hypothetical protein